MRPPRYEVVLKGREVPEGCDIYDDARDRADQLARETGREARVYRTSDGTYGKPVYRTGRVSDERF